MLCPHCKVPLTIADRQGIEIDFCPNCRGVWLDRGELGQYFLERAAAMAGGVMAGDNAPPPPPPPGHAAPPQYGYRRHDDDDDDDDDRRWHDGQQGYGHPGYPQQGYRRKRESWLGDLFDFD